MTSWLLMLWFGGIAHAAPNTKACRWVAEEVESAPDEGSTLNAIAVDREHEWDAATVACLRERGLRTPVVLAARRRVLRAEAGVSPGPYEVDPTDPVVTPTFDAAVLLSKRIEIGGKGWTGSVLLHPTFVDEDLPSWFHVSELLELVTKQERPGSQVPALDLAEAYEDSVPAYAPMREGGHLGNPAFLTKLADAPLSRLVGAQQRVVWLDFESVDGGVVLSWSMNRLDLGQPYLPVADPQRLQFTPVTGDRVAFDAHQRVTPSSSSAVSSTLSRKWPAPRAATVGVGFGLLAGGVAAVVGTYLSYDASLDQSGVVDPSNRKLVAGNTVGAGVAALGGVAGIVGLALPSRFWTHKHR